MKKLFLAICATLLLCSPAWAATYYISSSGDDTNNGTATSTPFAHMPGQAGCADNCSFTPSVGDVFVFKGGETWTVGATDDPHVTITQSGITIMGGQRCGLSGSVSCNSGVAWGTGYPVFDGGNNGTLTRNVFFLGAAGGKINSVFDGIKIYKTGFQSGGTADGSGGGISGYPRTSTSGVYLTVKNCWIETHSVSSIHVGTDSATADVRGIYLYNNTFKNGGRVTITNNGNGAGQDGVVDNIQIYGNTFYGPGDPLDGGYNAINFNWTSIVSGGTGYQVNDILTLVQEGASGATAVVNTVDGGGAVTYLTKTARGTGYLETPSSYVQTTCTRSGGACTGASGATINIGGYHIDGLMIQAENFTTYGITNLDIYNNKFIGDWQQTSTALIYLSGCTPSGLPNSKCTANLTPYGCCTGSGTGTCLTSCASSDEGPYSTQGATIHNNVFSHENSNSLYSYQIFSPGTVSIYNGGHDDVKIYNNTFDLSAYSANKSPCIDLYTVHTADIKNNIFNGCGNVISIDASADHVTIDYNLYYNSGTRWINGWTASQGSDCAGRAVGIGGKAACQATPFFQENASISDGDPKFVASPNGTVDSGNWNLQSGSPAASGGTNLGSPYTTDITGTVGTGRIGAYEYIQLGNIGGATFGGAVVK